ncbi:MAG TPA: hypothetical protein VGJ59_01675 [Jatrophihabitantaceae bacterium]|jgi:hypothetical protein
MARAATARDALDAVLARNRGLQTEVRALRAALDRVEDVLDHADKVSTSPTMTVYVVEVREAIRLSP